jgi:hypothetical protein
LQQTTSRQCGRKRRKTVENSYPLLVVTTDNLTALRNKKEEKQQKILINVVDPE